MTIQLATALAAALAGGGAALFLFLAVRRRRRLGAGEMLGAAVVLGLFSAAALVPLGFVGLRLFGVVRLAFLVLAAVVPALGLLALAVAAGRRVPVTRPALALAVLALLPGAAGAWARYVEPTRLVLERTTVDLAPERAGSDPVRIGVLADLQAESIGPHEIGAVDRLLREEPDLVLVPGDLFQAPEEVFRRELPALRALLGRLEAPAGAFFVPGDIDVPSQSARALAGGPVRVLRDEVATVTVGDRRIAIGGSAHDGAADDAFLRRFALRPDPDEVRILVVHRPDAVLRLPPGGRIDLVVAGHTHGGQVALPLFGPPITFSRVPRSVAAGGLHDLRGYPVYVSRGIGMERGQAPRIRFLCPPEVSLITLR